ncbi:MAG: addiction module antidote protein, HigA family [Candidatus Omnitrophota bacterium]|jgi:addiction module HigA family antidote|nr:MAG: addiction module antidote protein, HigA family [Candidatus Omnitrophota bacterium]
MLHPKRRPTLPGEILKEHYLQPRDITVTAFAEAVGYSRRHISRVIHGEARIEADLAARMAQVLNTTPHFWLNLQNAIDLYHAEQEMKDWKPNTVYHVA